MRCHTTGEHLKFSTYLHQPLFGVREGETPQLYQNLILALSTYIQIQRGVKKKVSKASQFRVIFEANLKLRVSKTKIRVGRRCFYIVFISYK